LGHALSGQGQVDDAPEAPAGAFIVVPGSSAVTDEDESDHVTTLIWDGDIVM
jgi:hypothetical protein